MNGEAKRNPLRETKIRASYVDALINSDVNNRHSLVQVGSYICLSVGRLKIVTEAASDPCKRNYRSR
jgi:hypothetical protein